MIGAALAVDWIGASMALGAFMAGVLLADSEYRHELEANIEPFKGLLLGMFIAVGMSANMGLVINAPLRVAGVTAGLMGLKWLAMFIVGKAMGLPGHPARRYPGPRWRIRICTVHRCRQPGHHRPATADLLILAVTFSMALTPLLYLVENA